MRGSAGKINGCMNMKNAGIRETSHGGRYNDLLGCRHARAQNQDGEQERNSEKKVGFRQYKPLRLQ